MTLIEQIVNRETDAAIVYESIEVIAFADHDPINFGHILIVPKKPYAFFPDLPEKVLSEINTVAKDFYQRIASKYNPDGISFIQNNGDFNDLGHYHLHIFPRFHDDKFGWTSSNLGVQTLDALRASLDDI
ncbi:MAG: HIT family protein [Oleispira sp.]|nr:HIT family protein [Oleispira sp.]